MSTKEKIRSAFKKFSEGERPENYVKPRAWYVTDPKTNERFPLKAIWSLAINEPLRSFNTSLARKELEHLGYECVEDEASVNYPGEDGVPPYEGGKKQVFVNKYERNAKARQACIEHYSTLDDAIKCQACEMSFEDVYGDLGAGFIHVHHIFPLSKINKEYEVDPIKHLVPLCPNCHAMIHRLDTDSNNVQDLRLLIKEMGSLKK